MVGCSTCTARSTCGTSPSRRILFGCSCRSSFGTPFRRTCPSHRITSRAIVAPSPTRRPHRVFRSNETSAPHSDLQAAATMAAFGNETRCSSRRANWMTSSRGSVDDQVKQPTIYSSQREPSARVRSWSISSTSIGVQRVCSRASAIFRLDFLAPERNIAECGCLTPRCSVFPTESL